MKADIALVNINLMYGIIEGAIDFQVYNPLGVLYLASSLEQEGYSVDLRDYQLFVKKHMDDPFDLNAFCRFIERPASIVGFSCMSNLLPFTLLAARQLEEENPEHTIILGGVGPTGVAREIIERFDWVDYVCFGEGDESLVDLMCRLSPRAGRGAAPDVSVPGFFLRRKGRVSYIERPRIANLDSLPQPAYHLIDLEEYDAALSVITSRGCPYHCTFCTETNHWNNRVVLRSIDHVIEEIKFIAARSTQRVFLFQDDQITLDRKRAKSRHGKGG